MARYTFRNKKADRSNIRRLFFSLTRYAVLAAIVKNLEGMKKILVEDLAMSEGESGARYLYCGCFLAEVCLSRTYLLKTRNIELFYSPCHFYLGAAPQKHQNAAGRRGGGVRSAAFFYRERKVRALPLPF